VERFAGCHGIQTLCAPGTRPAHSLQRIGEIFQTNGVVILYAGVDALSKLLVRSDIRPLLNISCEKNSLMTTYLALKRLLRNARLEPTILNMMEDDAGTPSGIGGLVKSLSECAKNFLDYSVQAIRIDPAQPESQIDADMRRLAARLLENALALRSNAPGNTGFGVSGLRELSRSH